MQPDLGPRIPQRSILAVPTGGRTPGTEAAGAKGFSSPTPAEVKHCEKRDIPA